MTCEEEELAGRDPQEEEELTGQKEEEVAGRKKEKGHRTGGRGVLSATCEEEVAGHDPQEKEEFAGRKRISGAGSGAVWDGVWVTEEKKTRFVSIPRGAALFRRKVISGVP